jgi:hypothetical protein
LPQFLAMTKGKHLAAIERLSVLGRHDDFGNVIGVTVHRDAAFEDIERHAFFFQVTIIDADQRRQLGASRVSAHKDTLRISTIPGDVLMHPAERLGYVGDQVFHFHFRQ